jgi:hypothetical protein
MRRPQPTRQQPPTFAHPAEYRALSDGSGYEPFLHGSDWTGDGAPTDRDHRACAFLVSLRPPNGDAETLRAFLEVGGASG